MTSLRQLSKHQILILTLGLGILSVIIVTIFWPYGELGLTYDSYDLLEGSQDLQTYLTGRNKDGHSYLVRAPFHPFVLSFFQNKVLAVWWINLFSIIAALWLVFVVCRLSELSIIASFAAVCVTGIFVPWLVNFQYVWTEPVFIVLILLLCVGLLKKWSLIAILVICFCLFATRKSGLFFFGAVSCFYAIEKKFIHAALLLLFGITTFFLWEWMEFSYESSGYFPEMLPKLEGYSRIYYWEAITSWFFPLHIPLLIRTLLLMSILLPVFFYFKQDIFVVFRQRQNLVLLTLAGVYAITLITFRGISEYEDGERYLTILFPLCVIPGVALLTRILQDGSKNVRIFISAGLVLWLIYISLRTVHHLLPSAV